jgi:hypothetical protein
VVLQLLVTASGDTGLVPHVAVAVLLEVTLSGLPEGSVAPFANALSLSLIAADWFVALQVPVSLAPRVLEPIFGEFAVLLTTLIPGPGVVAGAMVSNTCTLCKVPIPVFSTLPVIE